MSPSVVFLLLDYAKTRRCPQHLAEQCEGFTGADLAALVQEAALAALTESLHAAMVKKEHFERAFQVRL